MENALEAQWGSENVDSDKSTNATELPNDDNEIQVDGEELRDEELQESLDDLDANHDDGGMAGLVGSWTENDGLGDGFYQGLAFQNEGPYSVSNA
jgi:hypothetical protein